MKVSETAVRVVVPFHGELGVVVKVGRGVERASRATGGCLFFTFLGVVVTPPLFNLVHALSGSYAIAYALFGLPALLAGLQLILRRP